MKDDTDCVPIHELQLPSGAVVAGLSVSLLVSWGSLYYAFAVLAEPMQQTLGCDAGTMAGAFSLSLLMWGLTAYPAGLALQRWGGRVVMSVGALLAATAFAVLHAVVSVQELYFVWAALGVAMALTLYEAAFAVVVQSFAADHRRYIGWLTVVGGFASTVFWPLSHQLSIDIGWRGVAVVFSALHLLICLPMYMMLPAKERGCPRALQHRIGVAGPAARRAFVCLGGCFAIYGFVVAAMAVQVIPSLQSRGLDAKAALALAALIGPMQAAGRAIDLALGQRLNARRIGALTLCLMPLSIVVLWLAQWQVELCFVFVIVYGLGVGLLTVVKATAPLELFGSQAYARNSGALGGLAILARAAGPLGAAWLLAGFGGHSAMLLMLAIAAALGSWLYFRADSGCFVEVR